MPFEDELGEALRRAGEGFTTDRHALAEAGEQRGRRLVARRRAAVVGGSALALTVIATAGAYTGGLFDGPGAVDRVDVAAPPTGPGGSGKQPRSGTGVVTAEQLIANLKALLPGGALTKAEARGTSDELGPWVSGVYDDGKGKSAVSVRLQRVDPKGSLAREQTECGDKSLQGYDDCRTEYLADGSRLMLHKGYEYPDRRVDTKVWSATLVTPQGFLVGASEWNAAAEKGAPVSRTDPPLATEELKTLVTSPAWQPALSDLPTVEPEVPQAQEPTALRDRNAGAALEHLINGLGVAAPVVARGGEGEYGYVVLDDGSGRSLVQINVQKGEGNIGFTDADATVRPDGTRVKPMVGRATQGKDVMQWSVDTLRKDGLRVLVSSFNAADPNGRPTRDSPMLTMEQLHEIALAPGWNRTRN
ncbi:hypothetical protein OG592_18595 [Streptomyces avidinii]|uniref:hypothetical protein n=1 Tax=Streptomyces avidinii TaxID=1895 RepID=UPI00386B56C9|nr:hypothetical protein OG592_18595 [Streptomyces avidinii]